LNFADLALIIITIESINELQKPASDLSGADSLCSLENFEHTFVPESRSQIMAGVVEYWIVAMSVKLTIKFV